MTKRDLQLTITSVDSIAPGSYILLAVALLCASLECQPTIITAVNDNNQQIPICMLGNMSAIQNIESSMWLHQIKIEEMCANMNCVGEKLPLIGIQTLIQHMQVITHSTIMSMKLSMQTKAL